MRKIVSSIFTAGFMLFLLAAMALTVTREKSAYSYYENRNLTQAPELTLSGLLSGDYTDGVEAYLQDHAAGRSTLIELKTWADMYVLDRPVINDIVITDEALLPCWIKSEKRSDSEQRAQIKRAADNIQALTELCESCGSKYYYVEAPSQNYWYSKDYPDYLDSNAAYLEAAVTGLNEELNTRGVCFIDLGPVFLADDSGLLLMSDVDHHYTINGAYLAYRAIMSQIDSDSGFTPDILEPDDVIISELPNHFIGSRLRKVYDLWHSSEPLSVLTPKVAVPFTRCDNGVLSAPTVLSLPESPEQPVLYGVYMGGDFGETLIDTGRDELPSLLVYGDSFTNAAETMLYYSFNETRSLDLRYYSGGMSLGKYIETYRPDYVVCIRDYTVVVETSGNGAGPYGAQP